MSPADRARAFTLIELVAVCAILGLLLAMVAPAVGRQVTQARVAAETASLQALADAVKASFESTDLEGTNIAALPGSLPTGVDPTAFSPSTDPAFIPSATSSCDWFAKIARQLGDSPQVGVAPTRALQPRIAAVLVNPDGNTRVMLVGPEDEATQQRFLLVSLMAPAGKLSLPALPNPGNTQDPANLALFNDTWNTVWTDPGAVLPPSWTAALSAAQVQAWQGTGSTGAQLWLLCVQRIVCPKYTVTINNNHPSDTCYVCYNINGTTSAAPACAPPDSGTSVIPGGGVLYGRLIRAYRGSSLPPAGVLFAQFTLRSQCEITLQD